MDGRSTSRSSPLWTLGGSGVGGAPRAWVPLLRFKDSGKMGVGGRGAWGKVIQGDEKIREERF